MSAFTRLSSASTRLLSAFTNAITDQSPAGNISYTCGCAARGRRDREGGGREASTQGCFD